MDVNFGPKARSLLVDFRLEDIKVDLIEVNSVNTDVDNFTRVAEGWREFVVNEVAVATDQSAETTERLRAALQDFVDAVKDRRGSASGPVYIVSGTKPLTAGEGAA